MRTVFGRGPELEEVEAFLDRVPNGPVALVIAGNAGIGKTTLWSAALSGAEGRGHRALRARPAESEAVFSFAGLTDLLEPATDLLPSLPPPQRRALEVALLAAEHQGPHPVDHRTIAVAALSMVRLLAQQGPLVLAVDDVQWLDAPSAEVLQFVSRRLDSSPVGILVSHRIGESSAIPSVLAEALDDDQFRRMELGPLSPPAVESLVSTRLDLQLTRSLSARIHQVSGGNPFFALEVARAIKGREADFISGAPLPLTEDLRSLVRGRLSTLSSAGRRALQVVAAASQPSPEIVTAVLGDEGPAGIDDALRAGTIEAERGRLRPAHPLIGATAYLEQPAEDRRRLHSLLADAVDEPEQKARHLALAAAGPDEVVAAALEAAAGSAARRGAAGAAAELAEQAIRLTDPKAQRNRQRRSALAGYHHLRSANILRAKALLEEVVNDAAPGPERANSMGLLGEVVYLLGKTNEALSLFRSALAEGRDNPRVAAHIEMNLSMGTFLQTDYPASQAHSHAALTHAEASADVTLTSHAKGVVVFNDCLAGDGVNESMLASALELEDLDAPTMIWFGPTFVAPMVWMWAGKVAEANEALARLMGVMAERGQEATICLLGLYVTRMACWAGDLASARTYASMGRTASEHNGWAAGRAFASAAESMVACLAGDAATARRKVEEASGILGNQSKFRTICMMSSLGNLELSLGDHAAADRVLGPHVDFIWTSGLREPGVAPFVADEAEALVGLGREDEAERLIDWLEETGGPLDRAWALAAAARCRALLLASRGRLPDAMEQVEQALVNHKRLDMPIERARSLLVKGRLHRRNREKSAAQSALREALDIFEACGAEAWAAATRSELSRLGLRPRAPKELTPTESRVAELAASGLSTKAIAGEAFLSPKSVEGVLTRIYRKLDVHSRAQLASLLARRPDSADRPYPDGRS